VLPSPEADGKSAYLPSVGKNLLFAQDEKGEGERLSLSIHAQKHGLVVLAKGCRRGVRERNKEKKEVSRRA